ncbi:DUF1266 domain-containing protein [Variovorax sp. J22P271]|uniref:DUF1266 domain-containing protein n=1 Tax=Variovorax davisae TaxID=3053515 RepID=UPI002575AE5E|nr:DUF1266 domain-containing protein [Variovorax sp. J22P271]MDM0037073.1 DUF1266 domain-containing protein [Variovorax sp. J22P271]
MTAFVPAALICALLVWAVLRWRLGPSLDQWSLAIAFRPTESMSPEQLFGCLLSGNFALLMRDNFNQLASALSPRRIHRVLHEHWAIDSQESCLRVIHSRLDGLGRMTPAEKRAIAAWLLREQVDSDEYAALEDSCLYMVRCARIARVDELRHDRLSVMAWDIQQLAYLVRLACAVGYLSKPRSQELLQLLAGRARTLCASWKDYSLAALVGLGLRGSLEVFDHAEWARFARSHLVFLNPRRSPTRSASHWHDGSAPAAPVRHGAGSFDAWAPVPAGRAVAS